MYKTKSFLTSDSTKTAPLTRSRVSGFKLLLVSYQISTVGLRLDVLQSAFDLLGSVTLASAIDKAIELRPDAVVLDYCSESKDLIGIIYSLKRNLLTCHIPLIALTGKCNNEYKLESLKAGIDALISPPYSLTLLQFQIEGLIHNRKLLKSYYTKDASFIDRLPSFSFDEQLINRIERLLEANYKDVNYNVTLLAKELAISRTNLYTKIKMLTGRTTSEYVRIFRLKKGAELLKQGSLNVSEVTFNVGLKDPKYFSKIFKKLFGITPSEFMRRNTSLRMQSPLTNSSISDYSSPRTPA